MTHGPAKRRDIARSVLPSTRRIGARADLALAKRRGRRAVRQDLHDLGAERGPDAIIGTYEGLRADLGRYPDEDIRRAVRRRRAGDKLGPLFRWSVATTAHLPLEDRLDAVRVLVPDNLAGRHALSHLRWHDHFCVEDRWWRRTLGARRPPVDLAPFVRALYEAGEHRDLNAWMRTFRRKDGRARLLAGIHDIDAFARDCVAEATWRDGLDRYLAGQRVEPGRRRARRPG